MQDYNSSILKSYMFMAEIDVIGSYLWGLVIFICHKLGVK